VTGFLPPQPPDGNEPGRWEARPQERDDLARVVVATKSDAPQVVQAGEHPPRNAQAITSLGVGVAGLALLVVSVGLSFMVSLPCALIALVVGRRGRRRAEREGIGGERAAHWGVIAGIVGCVLCLVAAIGWILVIVLDLNVGTDFGRGGPSAPTELSFITALVRGHL
jgi:Flp pilus assembly protein TadB